MQGALVSQRAVLGLDPTVLEYTLVDAEPGADHTVGVSAGSKGGPGPMVIAQPVNIAKEGVCLCVHVCVCNKVMLAQYFGSHCFMHNGQFCSPQLLIIEL